MKKDFPSSGSGYLKDGCGFSSHLIKYDWPEYAVIFGTLREVRGVILSQACRIDDKDGAVKMHTFTTPIVGKEMLPCGTFDSVDTDDYVRVCGNMITKQLKPAEFRRLVEASVTFDTVLENLDILRDFGFTVAYGLSVLPLTVKCSDKVYRVNCDLFSLFFSFSDTEKGWLRDAMYLLDIACFLGVDLKLAAADPASKDEQAFIKKLDFFIQVASRMNLDI